ncbi:MAG: diguanylate cyclase/phosphodiesterase with sensor(s) [Actinomycetia bacterium]|nr:diguanylate cyclase/phosphodiesterase with sensor(s) [Actinomycetes bacterium]
MTAGSTRRIDNPAAPETTRAPEPIAVDELARLVADLLPVGVWEWEVGTDLFRRTADIKVSLAMTARGDAFPLTTMLQRVHPDDRVRVERAIRAAAVPGGTCEIDFRSGPGRSPRRLLMRGEARSEVDASSGAERVVRVVGAMLDVTKSHAAQAHIVEILETVSDGYFAVDDDWKLTYVNQTSERLWGRTRDELLGWDIWKKYPELVGTDFERALRGARRDQTPMEVIEYLPSAAAWYQLQAFPMAKGVAVYFRDVTTQREFSQERERLLVAEQRAVKEAQRARDELAHAATHDALTGLPNRTILFRDLASMLRARSAFAVLFLDLDRFKVVNDSLGHLVGDQLLVAVSERISSLAGPKTLTARLGGDEFVLVVDSPDLVEICRFAQLVVDELRQPFLVDGHELVIAASVGIANSAPDASPSTLLRDADAALYRAKARGRDRIVVHDDALRAEATERLELETELRAAIGGDQLLLHYQPIVRVRDRRRVGYEALVRWNNPRRGLLAPASFIVLAEESGLVNKLGEWALTEAAQQVLAWRADPAVALGETVWVNVSGNQLQEHVSLPATVRGIIERYGLLPGELGLEVTESILMRSPERAHHELEELRSLGVPFAVDDFGTGYSSLGYLQRFRPDVVKIDRSFISSIGHSETRHIVKSIIDVSHALGATVTAEGVERGDQLRILETLGCDHASGHILGRAEPVAARRRMPRPSAPQK